MTCHVKGCSSGGAEHGRLAPFDLNPRVTRAEGEAPPARAGFMEICKNGSIFYPIDNVSYWSPMVPVSVRKSVVSKGSVTRAPRPGHLAECREVDEAGKARREAEHPPRRVSGLD